MDMYIAPNQYMPMHACT